MQAETTLAAPPPEAPLPSTSSALAKPSAREPSGNEQQPAEIPPALRRLPVQLDLRIPVPSFPVHELLALAKGRVIDTVWPYAEDLPLWAGGVQLVWSEFEVVGQKLGIRVTRLI